ncbi:MAG TPA: hypothetical protein VFL72_07570 [Acidimicrobiia bacterium]|nr:hypothetical protein [Acidimicrobiia bacterium]
MPRRTLLAVPVLFALTVACTGPEVSADTQPLAPPDSFAPPTTAAPPPPTGTTIDVDRASIYVIDPMTLEAIPGLDPIPVGDWFWGTTSSNGSWLALYAGDETGVSSDLVLIDVVDWETIATWSFVSEQPFHVTDEGTIYSLEGSSPNIKLSRRIGGQPDAAEVAQLPDDFYSWYEIDVWDGNAVIFGYRSEDGGSTGEASIVTVDLSNGTVTQIPIPGVAFGTIDEVDIAETYPGVIAANPAVVWDHAGSRALVIHADKDIVTEVDLASSEVIDHPFGPEPSVWGELFAWLVPPAQAGGMAYARKGRMAVLSGERGSLHIATMLGDITTDENGWSSLNQPSGIVTVDTTTWQVVDRLDAPISEIFLSPDGDRLLATGYGYSETRDTYESNSSGFYLIDPIDLDVITHYAPGQPTAFHWGFSFSRDGRFGYVITSDTQTEIDVIDLETGVIINTRTDAEIQVFGEAGVLGEVDRGGP